MQVSDYLIIAFKNRAYAKKAWVYSVFGMVMEHKENVPYMIHRDRSGNVSYDASGILSALTALEGVAPNEPVARFTDRIQLKAGDVPNLKADVETTVGNLFFNWVVLVEAFGSKLDRKSVV